MDIPSRNQVWNEAIEAAARFVESHLVYPYSRTQLQPISPEQRQRYRKTNPPRVVYAEAIRAMKKE